MKRVLALLDTCLNSVLITLATTMVIVVTWQVFSRYVLQAPSSVTEEIARFQLIWLGLLGAVYTFRNRMHVNIDILSSALTGKARWLAELLALLACLLFAMVVLGYGGIKLVNLTLTLDQTSASLGVRMAYIYSVIPLSGALISLYASIFISDLIRYGVAASADPMAPDSTPAPTIGDK